MKKYIVKILYNGQTTDVTVLADSYYGLESDIRFFKDDKLVAIFKSSMVESIKVE